MLTAERRSIILAKLEADKKVQVGALSAEFDVSEETIRRDLERLEKEGHATRVYGGAVYNQELRSEPNYSVRKQTNTDAKHRIARQVASFIEDGDCLMLDESSTAMFVAKAIRGKKGLTVITNSLEVMLTLSEEKDWRIISTGGDLDPDLLAQTGHQAETSVRKYHVDKAVISCTGLDLARGCTCTEENAAYIKRAMMESAKQTILVADQEKFGKKAFFSLCRLSELTAIVTDAEPDDAWKAQLAGQDVDLCFDAQ